MYPQRENILVLKRAKMGRFGAHFGVRLPNGRVVDYTLEDGLRFVSIETFAEGQDVEIVRAVPSERGREVQRRLEMIYTRRKNYHLLFWNCETFANWLTGEEAKSDQIIGLFFLAAVFGVTAALS